MFRITSSKGLSTLDDYWNADKHAELREVIDVYPVTTVSLSDLFEFHRVPNEIDFMSIDTEGSEWDILRVFPFNRYRISIISVEHNFSQTREQISRILSDNGYMRIFQDLSQIDDWYVKKDLLEGRSFRLTEDYN